MPVTSFAPEFLELYKRASTELITIKLKTMTEGHKLRARLHTLRRDMREENHPLVNLANKVIISLRETTEGVILTAYPADAHFANLLTTAGIKASQTEEPSTPETKPSIDPAEEQLNSFFRGKDNA